MLQPTSRPAPVEAIAFGASAAGRAPVTRSPLTVLVSPAAKEARVRSPSWAKTSASLSAIAPRGLFTSLSLHGLFEPDDDEAAGQDAAADLEGDAGYIGGPAVPGDQ